MRGKQAPKRKMEPDTQYGSPTVTRLINQVMLDGKKSIARKHVYGSLDSASKEVKKKPMELLDQALSNVKPALEVRSRRVGGANYQIPVPVDDERQEALAVRWIVKVSRNRKGKDFQAILTDELVQAYKGEGEAVRMKEETERMAEANKAFAHFRW
jgi:small subunit ribosomal protein S7